MAIKKIVEFFLVSRVFIAFCAVALAVETNVLLHVPLNNISFYCFVFGATLVQYNLHYLVKASAAKGVRLTGWLWKKLSIHHLFFFIGCALILLSFFSFRLRHFYVLSILGAVAFLYSYPGVPFSKRKRLKDYGLLKILTLALLWTLVTVWFPVTNMMVDKSLYLLVFAKRFVFMFVLCLLFDIRDIVVDNREGINTLPVILGRKNAYIISNLGLFLFLALSIIHYMAFRETGVFLAMLLSTIATFFMIRLSSVSSSDFTYLGGIDGMMLLQGLLVVLFSLNL